MIGKVSEDLIVILIFRRIGGEGGQSRHLFLVVVVGGVKKTILS